MEALRSCRLWLRSLVFSCWTTISSAASWSVFFPVWQARYRDEAAVTLRNHFQPKATYLQKLCLLEEADSLRILDHRISFTWEDWSPRSTEYCLLGNGKNIASISYNNNRIRGIPLSEFCCSNSYGHWPPVLNCCHRVIVTWLLKSVDWPIHKYICLLVWITLSIQGNLLW